jgi:hypothetical protein
VEIRRTVARGLVVIGGVGLIAAGLVSPANASTSSTNGFLFCFAAEQGIKAAEGNVALLAPGEGETVQSGSPLTLSLSGGGGVLSTPTFLVASSPVLLATPDIDSGAGTEQAEVPGPVFRFTSTKATAVARTIYWAARFTAFLPEECKSPPITYTTPARSLIVTAPPPALSAPPVVTEPSGLPPVVLPVTGKPHSTRCAVPRLKGDSLALARSVLRKAHCALGRVHEPRHRTRHLRVTAQSVSAGRTLRAGSPVAVTLGPFSSSVPSHLAEIFK